MLRSSLRFLPFWTVALALATGCSSSSGGTSGGSGSSSTGGSATSGGSTGGSTGGGSTSSGGSSGGTSTGGSSGGVDAGCNHIYCNTTNPICSPADGGTCVQCITSTDCQHVLGKPLCVQNDGTPLGAFYANKCKQCQTSADCVSTQNQRGPICDTSGLAQAQGTAFDCTTNCLDGGTCSDPTRPVCSASGANTGLCIGCQSDTDCTSDPIRHQCDRVNGVCVQCHFDKNNPTLPNGDCSGTHSDAGPTSYCFQDPSGLPTSVSGTCVGCLSAADCVPPDFKASYALEGPTTACNDFDHTCEKACILPTDCRASQVKTVCMPWTYDPGSTFFCGCDPTATGAATGCGGEAPFCFPVPMTMPPVGFCSCANPVTGTGQCPAGQVCDPWNYIAAACRPGCVTNSDCADLPNDPICFPDAGICRECLYNSDCPTSKPICDPVSLVCRHTCSTNADCPPSQPLCNAQGNTDGLCYQCQYLPMAMPPPPTGCPSDKLCSGAFFTGASELTCL